MPVGTCALCRQTKDLQDSHFLPKAFYKLLLGLGKAAGQKNANPVALNEDIAFRTSAQVTDYLLCRDCEDLFSKHGEKWMVEHCWRSASDFPLRTTLKKAAPVLTVGGDDVFDGAAALGTSDISQLVYFAASVFWRGAVHQWGAVGGKKPVKLNLGTHEEALRLFLLAQGKFPSDAALLVNVSSSTDDGANELVLFPWKSNNGPPFDQYRLLIPGVAFRLFLGTIPKELMFLSITRDPSHPILLGSHDLILADGKKLADKATPKGNLAT
jgi:hypothetical protein